MSEIRVLVKRDTDDALCCPRCVALDGYDDAPDLAATFSEHDLPTAALGEPRPARETVPALGWYCERHNVVMLVPYSDVSEFGKFREGNWIAVPLHTETGQPLAAPVCLAAMLGDRQ
ncbi:hypothetical protein [Halococcus sediminicola]|uniref:hypothetical protein n=1 Tax=Halococcus sediminicola TaxID=1264579 RepID=UPI000678F7E2|nr:hypothetical protein [Halococcus sediminicola]